MVGNNTNKGCGTEDVPSGFFAQFGLLYQVPILFAS